MRIRPARNWIKRKSNRSKWLIRTTICVTIALILAALTITTKLNNNILSSPTVKEDPRQSVLTSTSRVGNTKDKSLFVTIVMPSVVNPGNQHRRLQAISETWGPDSQAIFVVHEPSILPNLPKLHDFKPSTPPSKFPLLLVVPPHITIDDGVQRIQYVIREVSKRLNPEFSFYANDHTFVIPDHLCGFIKDNHLSSNEHAYAGHALHNSKDKFGFNSGAAGYILSRLTVDSLIEYWDLNDPRCGGSNMKKWLQGNPGIVTARCLDEALEVFPIDTRDTDRHHIFHAYGIVRTVTGKYDQWYINKHKGFTLFSSDYENVLSGEECCSSKTVSFHYVEDSETRALYQLRKQLQELTPDYSNEEKIKTLVQELWPDNGSKGKLGGYSRGLPKEEDTASWRALISVLRKISRPTPSC